VCLYIYILDCGGELEGANELEKFMLGHGCRHIIMHALLFFVDSVKVSE